ncbi:hypothetical protein JT359_03875 [Candidatus Poribacteria bacterium]|nr:hypothetical protein [Candidatus Poribacteria bacterium]
MKKYQNIAAVFGIIGFILGVVIPGIGIFIYNWNCPFGNGILHKIVFLGVCGFMSAIVLGNLVGILIIGILKLHTYLQEKEGDKNGNRDI